MPFFHFQNYFCKNQPFLGNNVIFCMKTKCQHNKPLYFLNLHSISFPTVWYINFQLSAARFRIFTQHWCQCLLDLSYIEPCHKGKRGTWRFFQKKILDPPNFTKIYVFSVLFRTSLKNLSNDFVENGKIRFERYNFRCGTITADNGHIG